MVSHCCCMIGSWHECILKKGNKQHAVNFPSLLPAFVLNLALFVCPRVVFVVYLPCLDDCLVECCFHPFVRLSFWVGFQVIFFSIAITWSVRPSVWLPRYSCSTASVLGGRLLFLTAACLPTIHHPEFCIYFSTI